MTPRSRRRGPARTILRPERGGWWAMLMLLIFLAVAVASLLFSYFHLMLNAQAWPPEGIEVPDVAPAALATGALLASALAVWLAVSRVVRGDRTGLKLGLAAGFLLGIAGLGLQTKDLLDMPFTTGTNVYGSLFYALGGFGVSQLVFGLLMLAALQLWVWLGYFGRDEHLPAVNIALYWYFAVASWVPLAFSLYVSPHLFGAP